jgi:hypothetical protein
MELFTMGRGNYTEKIFEREQELLPDGAMMKETLKKEKTFMMKEPKLFRKNRQL